MKHWKKVSIFYQFLTFPLRKRLEGCGEFECLCSLVSGGVWAQFAGVSV